MSLLDDHYSFLPPKIFVMIMMSDLNIKFFGSLFLLLGSDEASHDHNDNLKKEENA